MVSKEQIIWLLQSWYYSWFMKSFLLKLRGKTQQQCQPYKAWSSPTRDLHLCPEPALAAFNAQRLHSLGSFCACCSSQSFLLYPLPWLHSLSLPRVDSNPSDPPVLVSSLDHGLSLISALSLLHQFLRMYFMHLFVSLFTYVHFVHQAMNPWDRHRSIIWWSTILTNKAIHLCLIFFMV